MGREKLESIINNFKETAMSDHDIDSCLKNLDYEAKNIQSISDYIFVKYNKCILLEQSSQYDSDVFFKELNDLNATIMSDFIDDKNLSEKIYYEIANLNFRVHKYEIAYKLLLISRKKESSKHTIDNIEMHFRKRWLMVLCIEYTGIRNSANINVAKAYLSYAISLLVGKGFISWLDNDAESDTIIDRIYSETNNPLNIDSFDYSTDIEPFSLFFNESGAFIEKTCDIDNQNTVSEKIICDIPLKSLLCELIEWKSTIFDINEKEFSDDFSYNTCWNDIIHILAHCLSEYAKISKGPKVTKRTISDCFYHRVSEALMRSLGDDYVTCYATLLIERNEYYAAIDALNKVQKKLINELKDERSVKLNRNIALVNFYIWYFSVLSNRSDGQCSKLLFKEYCQKSLDHIANTYYSILNMKECLIKGFEKIKINAPDLEIIQEELQNAYELLEANKPKQNIHGDVLKEWIFLKNTFSIFQKCLELTTADNSFTLFNMLQELIESYQYEGEFRYKDKSISKLFYHIILQNGSFVYKGDWRFIKKMSIEKKIKIDIREKLIDNIEKVFEGFDLNDVSNVFVSLTAETLNEDLEFIKSIVAIDSKQNSLCEKHNIFIDTSLIDDDNDKSQIENFKQTCYHNALFFTNNLKMTFSLCTVLSYLEKHLHKLQRPLDSFLISPVQEDVSYARQRGNYDLCLIDYHDIEDVVLSDEIPPLPIILGSCLSSKDLKSYIGKVLNVNYLHKNLKNNIAVVKYLFLISEKGNYVEANAFNLSNCDDVQNNSIFSDTIKINNQDLITSIKILNQNAIKKRTHSKSRKMGCGDKQGCGIECVNNFFEGNELSQNANYKALRDYLFSYLGIKLKETEFILVQNLKVSPEEPYLLCALNEKYLSDISLKKNLCQTIININSYIENSNEKIAVKPYKTLTGLESEIKPASLDKPFYFISYKSKNKSFELCEPVYKDIIFLQKLYNGKTSWYIDVKNFTDQFSDNITTAINSPNCKGAIVYISPDYIFAYDKMGRCGPTDDDKCYMETLLLNQRRDSDNNFHIFPVILPSSFNSASCPEVNKTTDFIKNAISTLGAKDETDRQSAFIKLFKCDTNGNHINNIILEWEMLGNHFKSSTNFKNAISEVNYE